MPLNLNLNINCKFCERGDCTKKPKVFFEKEEEQRKCFHFTNLQPLFAQENMKKHTYYYN